MAAVDMTTAGVAGTHPSRGGNVKTPYLVEAVVDFAAATTSKGSALAQGDTIGSIYVPANTLVLAAGMICKTAISGTTADLTVDLGFTGGDVDNFVDGWDLDAASAGDNAGTMGVSEPVIISTADTLDMLLVTQTGTLTAGEVRVWALMVDIGPSDNAVGIAAVGS